MTDDDGRRPAETDDRIDGGMDRRAYLQTLAAVGALGAGATLGTSSASAQDADLIDYEGRAADAAWREEATERIEEIRTTDLEVEVRNPGGQPMDGATVAVEMVEHEFDFGSAVSTNHVLGDSEDDERYRETFLEHFNKAVIENGMKYPAFSGPWGDSKEGAIQTLEWLAEHDVPARGHYLLWEEADAGYGGGMAIEDADSLSADELHELLLELIEDHASDVGDLVTEWDMHNHPLWQSNFRDREGIDWEDTLEWWEVGDEATDAELYTNEMGTVAGNWLRDQHYDFAERLVEDGAPIDGVGFMGHVQLPAGNVTPPEEMLETFDQFAELDVPILITEFDIQIGDRESDEEVEWQVDFLRDFLTASFSHEAVEGVMSWGFWAGDHWRPTGAYYDEDWNLRPHGETFLELVFEEWWTDERGETESDGRYATSAFKGDYRITAEKGELAGETTVTVDDETDTVVVDLVPPGKRK